MVVSETAYGFAATDAPTGFAIGQSSRLPVATAPLRVEVYEKLFQHALDAVCTISQEELAEKKSG